MVQFVYHYIGGVDVSITGSSLNLLERSLDATILRHKVIADNIANVDTPKFKRSDVEFESLLKNEMNKLSPLEGYRTDPRHFVIGGLSELKPRMVEDSKSAMNNNLNNVDIDREMITLASNQLRYNTLIQQFNHEFKQLHTAINSRG